MTEVSLEFLDAVCSLACQAGLAILEDKSRISSVSLKADESPLTSADMASQHTIAEGLKLIDSSIPVMSEETVVLPFEERKTWSTYFLIDPLDGTKEFIKGRKEYTVNIALIVNGVPELGVVYAPELNLLFAGARGHGSFRQVDGEERQKIEVAQSSAPVPCIVGSVSHKASAMVEFLEILGPHELRSFGSSLKICQVADGTVHLYPRFGPTSEWDTAAGHAVVLYAGGEVLKIDGSPLDYNQKESVLNPHFFVIGPRDRDWLALARQVAERQ